ncbi:hypothetical protein LP414_00210 [Polaromonas sp. P1(28)-13]|nr:hypothetical protein LP414_00210 [Polaromonas sp. P1(28)-13]
MLIEAGSLPRILAHIDGIATGLNAIGYAIIDAGFTGVRSRAVAESNVLWQVKFNTPEGVYFACLYQRAAQGSPLPSPERVLQIIRPFLDPNEGRKK